MELISPSFGSGVNMTFRKLVLFPPSGESWEANTVMGPLERADLSHSGMFLYEFS
jgi:hypothetical protein